MSRYSFKEYRLFWEAWCFLALARLSLLCFSFKTIAGWMAAQKASGTAPSTAITLTEISNAIQRASRYSPWRTKCFEQVLCARKMLSRRHYPSHIYFGVRKNPENSILEAHAWVTSAEQIITGGRQTSTYQILQIYS